MANVKKGYWAFYLDGRDAPTLRLRRATDVELLAQRCMSSTRPMADVIGEAARDATAHLRSGKDRAQWILNHASQIEAAGGDADAAYQAFVEGRQDQLSMALDTEVLEVIANASDTIDIPKVEEIDVDLDDIEDADQTPVRRRGRRP